MAGKFPWGALGRVQRFFSPPEAPKTAKSARRGAKRRERGSRGRFWEPFCLMFTHLLMCFECASAFVFRCVFKQRFSDLFIFIRPLFRSARKRPTCEKCNTLHAICCFFKVRARAGAASKTKKATQKASQRSFPEMLKITFFDTTLTIDYTISAGLLGRNNRCS